MSGWLTSVSRVIRDRLTEVSLPRNPIAARASLLVYNARKSSDKGCR
jgi:hypothetical protein